MTYKYKVGDILLFNTTKQDLSYINGQRVEILDLLPESFLHDYRVKSENGTETRVFEKELHEIEDNLLATLKIGQKVLYDPLNVIVKVQQIDYQHKQVSICFEDNGVQVVGIEKLRVIHREGTIVEEKQKHIVDDLINMFLSHYKNKDDTYTIPETLLRNILQSIYLEVE